MMILLSMISHGVFMQGHSQFK